MDEIYILDNKTYNGVGAIDEYKSAIWHDMYSEYGDFELYVPALQRYLDLLKQGYYVWTPDSTHQMVIEEVKIDSSVEGGNMLTVSGRSLESLLERRIIWSSTRISGNLQAEVKRLITSEIIGPEIAARKISNFVFEDSTDPNITSLTYESEELRGRTLYEVIKEACEYNGVGFSLTLNSANQFVFKLYKGIERTYDQISVPYVLFSPQFDNVVSSSYVSTTEDYRNYALVRGSVTDEGAEEPRDVIVTIGSDTVTGLDRRELYVDAADVQQEEGDPTPLETLLTQRGEQTLSTYKIRQTYDGEVVSDITYEYGVDYQIGDVVQLESDLGLKTKVRVIGFTTSVNTGGYSHYLTLDFIENDEEV